MISVRPPQSGTLMESSKVIELFYCATPNGHKITMFLEEAGIRYRIVPVDIGAGAQFKPDFLAISPNSKIPVIVDPSPADGGAPISVFESGAILLYLAEKTASLLPQDLRRRKTVLEWLFWQVGGLGPMAGQNHHFDHYAPEKIPYAIERYTRETTRLYGVLNQRLKQAPFVGGDTYSIADIAVYPWIVHWEVQKQDLSAFPELQRWFYAIAGRPGTLRAYAREHDVPAASLGTPEARKVLFGQSSAPIHNRSSE